VSDLSAPYFRVFASRRWITLESDVRTADVLRSDLIRGCVSEPVAYDSKGLVWTPTPAPPIRQFGPIRRLLARRIYDPLEFFVPVTWKPLRPYELGELQGAYVDAIDADDDVLTQNVAHDELADRVLHCSSFDDLLETWEWMETGPSAA